MTKNQLNTALILAAGIGSRMGSLTKNRPKALIEIDEKALLQHSIEKLISSSITTIIINVHHFSEQIISFVNELNYPGVTFHISDEREKLLDTGGAIKKAGRFLKDTEHFLVMNADILSTIDLQQLFNTHLSHNALATLAVRQRTSGRYLIFNDSNRLIGWKNVKTNEIKGSDAGNELAFSGIQILRNDIFQKMPGETVFSSIALYLSLMNNETIIGHIHNNDEWYDVGTPEKLKIAEKEILTAEKM